MRRFTGLVTLVASAALALTACTGGGAAPAPAQSSGGGSGKLSGTVKFQSWSLKNETFSPYFEALFASFEKETGVKVEWLDQPGEGYQEKVLAQANSGSLPDVINLPPDIAFPLAKAGVLLDVNAADSSLASTFVPGAWEAYSYPGLTGTFGIPWYLGTDLSWWNGTELKKYGVDTDKLPTTNEELIELAKKVGTESKGKLPVLSSMPTIDLFSSSGVPVMNDAGDFVFNTPQAAAIVDQFRDAYKAGGVPPEALTGDFGGNADNFKAGKVAYTTATSTFATDLAKNAPTIAKGVIATPRIGDAPLFVQGVSVAANSANKDAALAFAKYLTNTANQVAFCKIAVGYMPGTVEGSADTASLSAGVKDELQLKAIGIVVESMKTARVLTPVQWTGAMKTYMDQQLALALKGEIGSQEALDKIVKYANTNKVE
ncbi:extracellular solute-binding protein [Micropruina sp.]|uniref:ABC transporter substrate-binding protein n=1 Tax=Micropruina sp. TaxID=2737536 RepID=UPI0026030F3F|nr:extracellular solute-binding protein [Micropruina sp.]